MPSNAIVASTTVGIVDDEALGRACVRSALSGIADVSVVCEAGGVADALAALSRTRPDIIFLDVRMPDGDGFDVLAGLPAGYLPLVVFVTAFDAHAVAAFDAEATDYVLKPYEDSRIVAAVRRAQDRLRGARLSARASALTRVLQAAGGAPAGGVVKRPAAATYAQRIAVHAGDRHTYVMLSDVEWLEANGNHVRLHTRAGPHDVRTTMREMAAHLNPAVFMRVHRSAIVRIAAVNAIYPWFAGDYVVRLASGAEVRLSRTYRDDALRLFG